MPDSLSRDELLDELARLADELGETPTQRQMREQGRYSTGPYHSRFGSWNDALRAAGLTPNRDLTDEELVTDLQAFVADLGHTPSQREMQSEGPHSVGQYKNAFGSWNAALEAAGFTPVRERNIDRDALVDAFYALALDLEKIPGRRDMEREGRYSIGPYEREWGSWTAAKHDIVVDAIERAA